MDDQTTGKILNLLGTVLLETGRVQEASIILSKRCSELNKIEQRLPQLARQWDLCAASLSRALAAQGRIDEAEPLARRALVRAQGLDSTNSVLTSLAVVLRQRGAYAEAAL